MKHLIALAFAASLAGCGALADVPDGLPPSQWLGSNGVKQPTGFEVRGCPYYELGAGNKVRELCEDPWSKQPAQQNGGVSDSSSGGGER